MAQNDEFRIVASLDIPKSVSRIADDIQKSIVPEINKLDILKLTASLSDDTAKNIQGQLSKLSAQNMTINIGANVSNIQSQMQSQIISGIDIANKETDVLINEMIGKIQSLNRVDLNTFIKNLKNSLGVGEGEIKSAATELYNALKLSPDNQAAIVKSYEYLMDTIRNGIKNDSVVSSQGFDNRLALSIYEAATQMQNMSATTSQTMNTVVNSTQIATQVINQMSNATEQATDKLAPINTQYRTTFENIANVVKVAEDEFRRFGEVSSVSNKPAFTENGIEYYKDFTIQVKAATGEVQKFKYEMQTDENTGNIFYQLQNINEADAGIKKLTNAIEKAKASFQSKLANFESTNQGLTGGLQSEIQAVQTAINNLSTYDGIKNVEIAFNNLVASSKAIKANIKAVGSSLDPIDNAENVISKMPVDIRKLANGFSALKKQPEDADNIIKQLQNDLQKVIELEQQGGKNRAWSEAYKTLQQDLRNSTNYLKLLQETEKSSTSANSLVNNVKSYQTLLQQTASEWKSQGLYIGEVKKQMSSMLSHIGQIKNEAKLQEYVSSFDKLSANVLRLKTNLDAQVESQNKIYQLQTQIAKLGVNDISNKTYLTQQLADEEKKLQNLQMQSVTLSNLVSIAEQESIVTERTAKAREQMVLATNHQADTQMAKNIQQVNNYAISIENAIKRLNNLKTSSVFTNNTGNADVQNQISQINQLITKFTEAQTVINGMKSSDTIDSTQFANLTNVMTDLDTKFREVISSAIALQTQMKQTNGQDIQSGKIKILISQLEAFAVANSKAMKSNKLLSSGKTVSQEWNAMMSQLKAGADPTLTRQIANNFRVIRNEVKALGLEGGTVLQTLWKNVKKFSSWMGITMITASIAREVRGLFKDVYELDTALVDLRKTFKGAASDLEEFYYESNDIAKQLGVTTKEVINQASAWSRLGFNTKETAIEMSKMSSIFASISPDMNTDEATDGLLSIIKAFDVDVNDVLDGVISKVNKVGNEFGTSNGEIVNMLTRSSSAMKEANNTLEETIALETAAVEITRDAESVGTAFKTLSMRLRGYDEETESYTNDVEILSGKIADLTKTASTPGGISLFTDSSKTTYKSTVQLLREISAIYDDLSDKTQAELLEVLAGRRLPVYIVICA